jgi:hypothetical protein
LKIARWLGWGIGLSLLGAASAANAQDNRSFDPEAQENRIGLELDWLNTGGTFGYKHFNIVTWDLTAQIGVTPRLFIDVDIPWAYASIPGNPDRGIFGNPLVGLHFADSISRRASFYVGGALGIPVHPSADPNYPFDTTYGTASSVASIRAYAGLARFAPTRFPMIFRGGFEIISAPLFVRIDLAQSILIALERTVNTDVLFDVGTEFGLRARFGLLGGLRLQGNFVLTDARDHAQLALEPFIGYESDGPGIFVRAGLLVALDERLGFGFDSGKHRTARFSIGGKF